MDDDMLDLSALDPSRDEARWDALVTSIAARATRRYHERFAVTNQLAAWARPALAIAAALALVSWAGAWAHGSSTKMKNAGATQAEQPASVLARWAATGEHPTAARMLDVLGGADGQ